MLPVMPLNVVLHVSHYVCDSKGNWPLLTDDALLMHNNHDMQSHRNKSVGLKSGNQAGQAADPPLPVPLPSQFSFKKMLRQSKFGGAVLCCSLIYPDVARGVSSKYTVQPGT
jgi:hypothetical protein